MIDNSDWSSLLEKLESLADEALATRLLSELNQKSSKLGKLLLNKDESLDHGVWKASCDDAREEVDKLVKEIENL